MAAVSAEATRELRALDEAFVRHVNAGDAAQLAACYAEDARILPPNHPLVSGRAEIRQFFESMLAAGVADFTLDTTHIELSAGVVY